MLTKCKNADGFPNSRMRMSKFWCPIGRCRYWRVNLLTICIFARMRAIFKGIQKKQKLRRMLHKNFYLNEKLQLTSLMWTINILLFFLAKSISQIKLNWAKLIGAVKWASWMLLECWNKRIENIGGRKSNSYIGLQPT